MTQQQAVQAATAATVLQIDRRSTERQVLFLAINSLKAAEANLAATHRAVSDDWAAKMSAENELVTLRITAEEMGALPMVEKITRAVESAVEPSIRYADDAEEKLGKRFKVLLQDVEFFNRRRAARENAIPDEERAVSHARHKVREAALSVLRASSAAAMVAKDLAGMQAALVEKRVQLHFFISNDLVDDAPALQRLMALETQDWRAHPAALKWSGALERLMADADAELPNA